jgi:hypothetical protein
MSSIAGVVAFGPFRRRKMNEPVESTSGVILAMIGLVACVAIMGYFLVMLSSFLGQS